VLIPTAVHAFVLDGSHAMSSRWLSSAPVAFCVVCSDQLAADASAAGNVRLAKADTATASAMRAQRQAAAR
jgi:hypothetical protein